METRVIEARLRKLNNYVGKLKRHRNVAFDQYLNNDDLQDIIERRLQLAIQVCIDIGNYIIAHQRLEIPEDEPNIFKVLSRHTIIPATLAERIKGMVRFRNILVHDYLEIDQSRVYQMLTGSLSDFDAFAGAIVVWLDRKG